MTVPASGLPDQAWLVALAELPDMWPTRLAALLGLRRGRAGAPAPPPARSAHQAWEWLLAGEPMADPRLVRRCQPDPPALLDRWRRAAGQARPADRWHAYRSAGVALHPLGSAGYPPALASDHAAPYLLTAIGDLGALDGPRAAVVGTRRATASGRETAWQFGRELAEAGVRVVSGLALGIDGAAHTGALSVAGAPPVGVVAGGLDRPYPTRHRALWREVASRGVLCSEVPLGTPNEAWRFPARNRVLAALATVVVVVECHSSGGSMITVDEALARGRTVLAVPGPVRSPASAGTNKLLREGAPPACDTADILTALALEPVTPGPAPADDRPQPPAAARTVLEAVDYAATSTEAVLARTGLPPGQVTTALALLEMDGWVRGGGGWWERLGPGPPAPE